MDTITKFTWENGTENKPVPLTDAMIDKLIEKKDSLGANLIVKGYYTGCDDNGNDKSVTSSRVRIMNQKFGNELHFAGLEISDDYDVLLKSVPLESEKYNISEGNSYEINISRKDGSSGIINAGYLSYFLEFDSFTIPNSPNNFSSTNIINKISITEDGSKRYLTVATPTENLTWSTTFRIKTCIQGDENSNDLGKFTYSKSIECSAKRLNDNGVIISISSSNNNRMLTESVVGFSITYDPPDSTKIDDIRTFPSVSNNLAEINKNTNQVISKATPGKFTLGCDYKFSWDENNQYTGTGVEIEILQITKMIINQSNDTPTITITPTNGNIFTSIRNNAHCYVGKYKSSNNSGIMYIKQLSDTNKELYADGTSASDDIQGSGNISGDVFLKLPTFYYKGENKENDVVEISFSLVNPGGYTMWNTNDLIGVYEASIDDGKLYSQSNKTPVSSTSYNDFKAALSNRSIDGLSLVTYKAHVTIALLYYGIYANVDSQNNIGDLFYNNSSAIQPTGSSNQFGMTDTDTTNTGVVVNFLGLENWCGGLMELMDGIVGSGSDDGGYGYVTIDNRLQNVQVKLGDQYVTKFVFGEYADLIPKEYKTTENNNGFCDAARAASVINHRVARGYGRVGITNVPGYDGISAIAFSIPAGYNAVWSMGTRIMFNGSFSSVSDIGTSSFNTI